MTYLKTLGKKDDLDDIILYLQGGAGSYELSTYLQGRLDDMNTCRDMIRQYGSRIKVCKMLCTSLHITKGQAEKLYTDTCFVYNTTQTSNRDFWIDISIGNILETRAKALIKGDFKTAAQCDSNLVKQIAEMTDSKDAEIYRRINVQKRILEFNPELTGVKLEPGWEEQVQEMIRKGRNRDITSIQEAEILADGE